MAWENPPCYKMTMMYSQTRGYEEVRFFHSKYIEWLKERLQPNTWWAGGQVKVNGQFYTEALYFESSEDLLAFSIVFGPAHCPIVDKSVILEVTEGQ